MRPRAIYVIFDMGRVIAIVTGYEAARKLSPHRAYKPFKTELGAEEYAAWWNHQADARLAPRDKPTWPAATPTA